MGPGGLKSVEKGENLELSVNLRAKAGVPPAPWTVPGGLACGTGLISTLPSTPGPPRSSLRVSLLTPRPLQPPLPSKDLHSLQSTFTLCISFDLHNARAVQRKEAGAQGLGQPARPRGKS